MKEKQPQKTYLIFFRPLPETDIFLTLIRVYSKFQLKICSFSTKPVNVRIHLNCLVETNLTNGLTVGLSEEIVKLLSNVILISHAGISQCYVTRSVFHLCGLQFS